MIQENLKTIAAISLLRGLNNNSRTLLDVVIYALSEIAYNNTLDLINLSELVNLLQKNYNISVPIQILRDQIRNKQVPFLLLETLNQVRITKDNIPFDYINIFLTKQKEEELEFRTIISNATQYLNEKYPELSYTREITEMALLAFINKEFQNGQFNDASGNVNISVHLAEYLIHINSPKVYELINSLSL